MTNNQQPTDIRTRLEAHAAACRAARRRGEVLPPLPGDLMNLGDANLGGAYLGGAYLGDANLGGAYLGDANLGGAYLSGAYLSGANLRGANLRDANLGGAYLSGAYLGGANLGGAYLSGAKRRDRTLSSGAVRTVTGGRHAVLTYQTTVGRVLEYGCEAQTIADWRTQVDALCKQHESSRSAYYAAEIRALLAWCETLDMPQENPK